MSKGGVSSPDPLTRMADSLRRQEITVRFFHGLSDLTRLRIGERLLAEGETPLLVIGDRWVPGYRPDALRAAVVPLDEALRHGESNVGDLPAESLPARRRSSLTASRLRT